MKKAPCKNCEKRHAGCHAGCEEYNAWAAVKRQESKERLNKLELEHAINNAHFHRSKTRK